MLKVGVIGYGYWGPNIVRNLFGMRGVSVKTVCDHDVQALKKAKDLYPGLTLTRDAKDVTDDPDLDVVAVITPIASHYSLAKRALEHGKHVFVEKPFTETVAQAETLIALARQKKKIIMVDHTFIFTGAVTKIKNLIDRNTLGDIYYYDSTRVSLGLFQQDSNVIQDLAPHDFSIIDYIFKNRPVALAAHGADHMGRGHENLAYITIYLTGNLIAHINVNWLSPVKVRTILIGGKKKMLVWDDLNVNERIKIYNKGVELRDKEGLYRLMWDYRSGDMHSPRIEQTEALKHELHYFVQCIRNRQQPVNDGRAGLRVVRMLKAANESLKKNGKRIKL